MPMSLNILQKDENSVNLGSVYESVVAQELHAHGFPLHYYDNKQKGEVDFLVDDYTNLTVLPLEIKSGKDYTVHSALDNFINTPDYNIHNAVVLSNAREVYQKDGITYQPIYYCMFYQLDNSLNSNDLIIPEIKLSNTER